MKRTTGYNISFEKAKVKQYTFEVHEEVMVVDGIRYRRTYSTYEDGYGWSIFDVKKRTFEPIDIALMCQHHRDGFNLESIYQKAKGNPLYD